MDLHLRHEQGRAVKYSSAAVAVRGRASLPPVAVAARRIVRPAHCHAWGSGLTQEATLAAAAAEAMKF